MKDIEGALALNPKSVDAVWWRAVVYAAQGDKEAAKRDFEAAEQLDPAATAALRNRWIPKS